MGDKSYLCLSSAHGADTEGQEFLLKDGAVHILPVQRNRGEGGLKERLPKSLLYCRLFIFLWDGSNLHPSNQPPVLVDLMPVLPHLPDI